MLLIKQISIFLGFWFIGELISNYSGLPVPGSIIAMLLLVVSLELKIVKKEDIDQVANFLLNNMAMFFIPAGVGLICYFEIIKEEWIPILSAITISAILVLAVVGLIIDYRKR